MIPSIEPTDLEEILHKLTHGIWVDTNKKGFIIVDQKELKEVLISERHRAQMEIVEELENICNDLGAPTMDYAPGVVINEQRLILNKTAQKLITFLTKIKRKE